MLIESNSNNSKQESLPSNNMPDLPIVELNNISVQYRVPTEQIGTFKEFVIRKLQGKVSLSKFWALDDVSMLIKRGEVFGLVGKNGAGKSTLLKVIAKVLRPTKGNVKVYGKIAPLLAVGAGFHPELTGRENIFFNGALLGYSKEEMNSVYREIVDFSEIGQFIDAPVRTYSSGMFARLAFSAATAHMPELLIVDEVLSVGDAGFQQKCNLRIRNFQEKGATIILVSHGMDTIEQMCHRAAWIDHGKLRAIGLTKEVITAYKEETI